MHGRPRKTSEHNFCFEAALNEVGESHEDSNPARGDFAGSSGGFAKANSGGQQQAEKPVVMRSSFEQRSSGQHVWMGEP